jgi:hypothetical protein
MSKGLSKLQRTIVGLLDGSLKRQFYRGGALITSELLAELVDREAVREDMPRNMAMFTVRRACMSLVERGILEGEYSIHADYPWAKVITWRLVSDQDKANPAG